MAAWLHCRQPLLGALLLGAASGGTRSLEDVTWDSVAEPRLTHCPIEVPAQTWPPSASVAYVYAGMVDVHVDPLADAGSQRTLLLQEGHCWNGGLRSEHYQYSGGGDAWMALLRKDARLSRADLELFQPKEQPAPGPAPPRPPAPSPPDDEAASLLADAEAHDGEPGVKPGEAPKGGRRCSLSGVSVHQLSMLDDVFQLRLQYEGCHGSGHGLPDKAAVEFQIKRCSGSSHCSANLVPWMCELSRHDRSLLHTVDLSSCPPDVTTTQAPVREVTTTAAGPGEVSLSIHAVWKQVGPGRCFSPGLQAAEQVQPMQHQECQQMCFTRLASVAAKRYLPDQPICRGYAYNTQVNDDGKCILYTARDTEVTQSDTANDGGWMCWALHVDASAMDVHMPRGVEEERPSPPPVVPFGGKADVPRSAMSQSLRLFPLDAHARPTSAVLRRLEPLRQSQSCFASADWYTLESSPGNPATIGVPEHHWPALLKLVPGPLPVSAAVKAPGQVTLQRVCVNVCALGSGCEPRQAEPAGVAVATSPLLGQVLAAGLAAVVTGIIACCMVSYDCCFCLTTRHPTKPNYRLVVQEYMPGDDRHTKMHHVWHSDPGGDDWG